MKITKSKLAQIVQEELSNTMTEGFGLVGALSAVKDAENQGMADAQDDFMRYKRGEEVSPDLPSFGSAEEEEAYGMAWGKEWHRLMDNAATSAAERKLNRPPEPEGEPDVQHYDGEFFQEGTNKMKITKSKLSKIVQEELAAIKAEGYGNYKRDEKNPNPKGLSPQYRGTDAASTDDTEERFHKSEHSPYSDKKPKRGKKGLDESIAPYDGLEGWALDALQSLGGEQPLSDIAAAAMEPWAMSEWDREDGMLDEEDWFYSIQAAMDNLASQGKVRLTQGGPGSTDEDFYALA